MEAMLGCHPVILSYLTNLGKVQSTKVIPPWGLGRFPLVSSRTFEV